MAEEKSSFVLYADYMPMVSKLSDAKAGKLFKLILEYVNDKNPTIDDLLLQIAFEPIKQQLKRDLKLWEAKRSKRKEAGKAGGIKSGQSRRTRSKRSNASKIEANEAVNVNDNVNVTVNVNDTINKKLNKKELTEGDVLNTIEFCSITLNRKYEGPRIMELFKAFLIQNENESYLKKDDQIRHFRNWIKTQPYENGIAKQSNSNSSATTRSVEALLSGSDE